MVDINKYTLVTAAHQHDESQESDLTEYVMEFPNLEYHSVHHYGQVDLVSQNID